MLLVTKEGFYFERNKINGGLNFSDGINLSSFSNKLIKSV